MERKGKGEEDADDARGVNEGGSEVDFYEVREAGDELPESRNLKEQRRDHGGLLNQRWAQLKGFFSAEGFDPLLLHVVASLGVVIAC